MSWEQTQYRPQPTAHSLHPLLPLKHHFLQSKVKPSMDKWGEQLSEKTTVMLLLRFNFSTDSNEQVQGGYLKHVIVSRILILKTTTAAIKCCLLLVLNTSSPNTACLTKTHNSVNILGCFVGESKFSRVFQRIGTHPGEHTTLRYWNPVAFFPFNSVTGFFSK